MRVHPSPIIVLLVCSQAVNKDGTEKCTLPGPNLVHGLYIGQLDSSYYCEALRVRRSMVIRSTPDVFCVGNKIFRIIDGPLKSEEFTSSYVDCVMKKVCVEDLGRKRRHSFRWMRLTCAKGHLYFTRKPTFVDTKQLENILGVE